MNETSKKRLVILGGGESGIGAAVLGKVKGMDVFLSDSGRIPPRYLEALDRYGIAYEQGGHTPELILNADEVVKSPGVPPTAPMVKAIVEKGISVISEIEFAGRYSDSRMVCITGSNGKTTTTMLIYHILREAGVNVGLAGNVGRSLAWQVAEDHHDVYVVELSSFQLENMYDFHSNVAVLMNITPDHLDRYDNKMQNYIDAKFRILRNLTPDDAFVYWEEDPIIMKQLETVHTPARHLPLSEHRKDDSAAWLQDDELCIGFDSMELTMPKAQLALKGVHNMLNSMAAGLSAAVMGVKKEDIRRALSDFEGVEHRLEHVETIGGARWINDSKATNVNSCWYALGSMPEGKHTVLILGGKDKGNDYNEILPLVEEKVKAIVAMGKDNTKIIDFFKGKVPVLRDTHSLAEAVAACRELAQSGDTVLLSPCCASFDLFFGYEDRGTKFKDAVRRMKKKEL